MKRGLVVIDSDAMDRFFWCIGEDDTVDSVGHSASIAGLPRRLLDTEQVTLILRGDTAATRRISLPVRRERALSEAARLEFEDILADSVEAYSFGFSRADERGFRTVTAFPRDALEEILSQCLAVGLDPDFVTVDHAALGQPDAENVVLYAEEDRLVAQLDSGAFTGPASLYSGLLEELLASEQGDVLVLTTDPALSLRGARLIEDDAARGRFFLTALSSDALPNLRRGLFAKQRNWLADAKRWRGAGALMAACLTLWIVNMGLDAVKHRNAADRLYAEAEETFQKAFPGTPIRDLKRQARARQKAAATSSFLDLSVQLATTLQQFDRLSLANIRYTDNGELVAELRFPDATSLEQLKTALQGQGVSVREDGNLRRDDDGNFAGRLYLGRQG
ncbi:MAG: type II secretion system protein GspL [Parvularcula sp.]